MVWGRRKEKVHQSSILPSTPVPFPNLFEKMAQRELKSRKSLKSPYQLHNAHKINCTCVGHCEIDTFDSPACHNLLSLLISFVVKFLFWKELKLFLQVSKITLYIIQKFGRVVQRSPSPQIINKVLMNIGRGFIWVPCGKG